MIVSFHITKETHEGVHVPKFDDQNELKVLGNTIKKDSQKLNEDDQTGLKVKSN
jgi:hypothetical protein